MNVVAFKQPDDLDQIAAEIRAEWMRYEAAFRALDLKRQDQDRTDWIDSAIELGNLLHRAYPLCGGRRPLARWLQSKDFASANFANTNGCMALDKLSRHPELAREALKKTTKSCWHWIWHDEVKPFVLDQANARQAATASAKAAARAAPRISRVDPRDEIIMYGRTFWPGYNVTHDQCRAATWLFQDLLRLVDQSSGHPSVQDKAIAIRTATRSLQRFTPEIVTIVDGITNAMAVHPDGPCQPPPHPTNGKW